MLYIDKKNYQYFYGNFVNRTDLFDEFVNRRRQGAKRINKWRNNSFIF